MSNKKNNEELEKILKAKEQELEEKNKEIERLQKTRLGLYWDKEKEPEQVVLDCEENLPVLQRIKDKEIENDKGEENIVGVFIKDVCEKNNFKYLKEANAKKIKNDLGYDVPVDKSSRRYDFVIDNGKELFIIETNFYGGGGSKLKATAGEYRNLSDVLNGKYKFFWITDGMGWKTTANPLRETFAHNDYVFNLAMLEKDILEFVLLKS